MERPRIGFVGIGLMGHGIAKNLLAKGFPVTLRLHRSRERAQDLFAAGATEVPTYAALAQASDVVMLCVTGAPEVEAIVRGPDGVASAARPGLVVIDTSTSEPSTTTRMRESLAPLGVAFVDAPLSRTPAEAEQGRLNTMVGADEATFERLRPVFAAYCENIVHAGPPGHGLVLKLVNNFVGQAMCAAFAEAMAAASRAGLSLERLYELMSAGPLNSPMFQMFVGKARTGDLTGVRFSLVNAAKDLRYYTHLVEAMAMPSIMGEATHQSLVIANALGFGDRFVPSLVEAQEKLNGVAIVPR